VLLIKVLSNTKWSARLWCCAYLLSTCPVAWAAGNAGPGIRLFDDARLAEARQFFVSFAKQYPEDPQGAFYLGRIAFASEQYGQAISWFEQATQLATEAAEQSDYHLWLGRSYGYAALEAHMLRQPFLALRVKQHFEKAVTLNPDNIPARTDLREYYLQAPGILGGSDTKAKQQAEEIAKRRGRQ
jgi:tetratricopeptide (TPR) repeat protein